MRLCGDLKFDSQPFKMLTAGHIYSNKINASVRSDFHMPYDKQVLLHETSLCSPFYVCVILWLPFNEYGVSLFKLALGVCHCGMQRVMMILNIRTFRADNISYFMNFRSLKAITN